MAYITAEDVKLYKGITNATDDALITDLIASAQLMWDEWTLRTFEASANSNRLFDALKDTSEDRYTLYLDRDLASINSITNGDGTSVTSSQYVTEPRNDTPYYAIRLKANSSVVWTYSTDPENSITVNGKWAYSTEADARVKQAMRRLVTWLYQQKDNTMDLEMPKMSPDGTLIMPPGFPRDVAELARKLRRL